MIHEVTQNVVSVFDTKAIQNVKFAIVDNATSGDNHIVAAVTGKKIRVLHYTLVPSADVTVRWESAGTPDTFLTGEMQLLAEDGVVGPSTLSATCKLGLFETLAGEGLDLQLSGAVSVDGHITYVEVTP